MGFFTDAHDLLVIGLLPNLLSRIYYHTEDGLSLGHTKESVMATLCFSGFWLGFSIGGDHPLYATTMSEYSNTKTRGAFVAAVFAMQRLGYLRAFAMTIIVTKILWASFPSIDIDGPPEADWVWRIILMLGAVPAALTFYSKSKMLETACYTALIERDEQQAALEMGNVFGTNFDTSDISKTSKSQTGATRFELFSWQFAWHHGKELLGCYVTWFLLDISYHNQLLFQTQVFGAVGWIPKASMMTALEEISVTAKWTALLALLSTVPGYWFIGIITLLLINSTINFIQENNPGNAVAALMAQLALKTKMLRDGNLSLQRIVYRIEDNLKAALSSATCTVKRELIVRALAHMEGIVRGFNPLDPDTIVT